MLNETKFVRLCYLIFVSTVVLILITHSPVVGYDTASYLNFSSKRPPLYPIFIWLFKWCGHYQFEAVTWAKTIIFGASLFYTRIWLRTYLMISDFLIFLVLSATTILMFRMTLISESLSVPLFIVTFFIAVEAMKEFRYKKLISLCVLTSLLVLTRNQFYFFYLFFVGLIFWYFWKKIPTKKILISSVIIICSIIITVLITKLYYYVINAPTDCSLSLGHQAIIQPLYLTDTSAINYFKDPIQKDFVKNMLTEMKNQKLTSTDIPLSPPYPSDIYSYYEFNYDPIGNMSCAYIANLPLPIHLQNNFIMNITMILFLHEFKKNLYFYTWKYALFFGNIPSFFCMLIVLLAIIYSILNRFDLSSTEQVFVIVGCMIILLNNLFVALVASSVVRYLFYNYFIYYCFAALAADRIFFKNHKFFNNGLYK